MKKILITSFVVGLLVMSGCSKEEPNVVENPVEQQGSDMAEQPQDNKNTSTEPIPTESENYDFVEYEQVSTNGLPKETVDYIEDIKDERGYAVFSSDEANTIEGEYIIFVSGGEKHEGGHTLKIIEVQNKDNKTVIELIEEAPGGETARKISYPHAIIKVPNINPDNIEIISPTGKKFPRKK